jgi:hypothetical protein
MPWRCPVCRIPIEHNDLHAVPRPGVRYRCHICRLEFVVDPATDKLTLAPPTDDESEPRLRRTHSNDKV